MNECPACGGNGHRPDAPWLLCPAECAAVQAIRDRSANKRVARPAAPGVS